MQTTPTVLGCAPVFATTYTSRRFPVETELRISAMWKQRSPAAKYLLYGKSISDVTVQRGGVHLRRFAAIGRAQKYSFNDRHPFFLPGSLTILKECLSLEGQLRGA